MQKALIVTFILSILVITAVASYLYYQPTDLDLDIDVDTDQTDEEELNLPNTGEPTLEPTGTDSGTHEEHQPFTYDSVSAGEIITAHYQDHQYSGTLGLHRMDIKVNQDVSDVEISVHSHDTFDKGAAAPGIVFKYPHVEAENLQDSQIDSVKYHFQVPESWVDSQGISPESISIYKWNEATSTWEEQKVSYDSADGDDYFYHVNLKSFGEFAIAA